MTPAEDRAQRIIGAEMDKRILPGVFDDREAVFDQLGLTVAIAAMIAVERQAYERAAQVAECHFDDRPRMGHDFRWHDGYEAGCKGSATAIRALGDS